MTKILLVEDDKGLREIYSVRLLAEGYTLISSGDGEEALAAWNGYCTEVESVMLEGFTAEEEELLCSFLTRIADNFRRQL